MYKMMGIKSALLNSFLMNLGIFQLTLCSSVNNGTRDARVRVEETVNVTPILNRILKDYDKYERPFIGGKPVQIGVRFLIISVNHVSEEDMEFQMSVDIVQRWIDPRLAINKTANSAMFLSGEIIDKIWLPDTFIQNARKIEVDAKTNTVMLYANGTVDYAYRAFVTVMSTMHFYDYPMDHQTLHIQLFSYRYTTDKIKYTNINGSVNYADVVGFIVHRYEMKEGSEVYYSGEYSYLLLSITIARRLGYFIMQFYFPCILCAVVSWLPFWMDRYEIGDRVSLGITTLLTEVFLSQYINSAMPHVSYIKAADEFILTTFIFIFLALMEHVIVYAVREDTKEKEQGEMPSFKAFTNNLCQEVTNENPIQVTTEDNNEGTNKIDMMHKEVEAKPDRSLLVDKISRVLFPLSYLTLVAIYFIVHTCK
ncbi:gamma-aminobutyric acid receptor subunit rho-2-like isoform X2 [Actinia tenebrosa]|uniref:Gamma-aminobutyric acid receptor subunit rho-2-like isoform X2 n=1 Tax=Actinia tenebrosa TaxID=6105 RepID=A0A6P8I0P2_ACTTE|nr:gamma-aminobutyric acid receptor subunit rho-2-like isoform X2 [Actinia tenebrosa]